MGVLVDRVEGAVLVEGPSRTQIHIAHASELLTGLVVVQATKRDFR